MFTADGTVRDSKKSASDWMALTSKSIMLLKEVQVLLLNFGIKSVIYDRSRPPREGLFEYITKNGERRTYNSDGVLYELGIFGANMDSFKKKIGFIGKRKNQHLENIRFKKRREKQFTDTVVMVESAGLNEVYDLTEPVTHSMVCNSIIVHQCGEQPLLPYESCNLGSINLGKFVENGKINYERLSETVRKAVHFLDNVIDMNKFPLKQIEEMTKSNRKIGLGVMGFADMLFQLNFAYNSKDGVETGRSIMKFVCDEARKMSEELGRKRGSFQNFKDSIWASKFKTMRNATVTTIAPTGTLSMIADCSSGVEPLFAVSFIKRVMDNKELVYVNEHFENYAKKEGFYSEELMKSIANKGSIQNIKEIPDEGRRIFVVSHDIRPEWHVNMQAAFQEHTDNAVSKTVNFPNWATTEDVKTVYLTAYKLGCKGVTVYRDGSRENQVLNIEITKKEEDGKKKGKFLEKCPECGSKMKIQEGCSTCPQCGYSICSL